MPYRIEFLPDAEKDYAGLDRSIRKEVVKKMDGLAENPFLGKLLRNKWIASDISCGLSKELANDYNKKNIPCIEIPCGFAGGSLQFGIDLAGFYKLYVAKKKDRIVYRLLDKDIEIIEIVGIGKREKEEIYKLVASRLKKLG